LVNARPSKFGPDDMLLPPYCRVISRLLLFSFAIGGGAHKVIQPGFCS
jgi:hypothetical protein